MFDHGSPNQEHKVTRALHSLIAVDVLGNLILCVTQVNWTVCIRRSIMKDKRHALILLHQELIDVVWSPIVNAEAAVHRKWCA